MAIPPSAADCCGYKGSIWLKAWTAKEKGIFLEIKFSAFF